MENQMKLTDFGGRDWDLEALDLTANDLIALEDQGIQLRNLGKDTSIKHTVALVTVVLKKIEPSLTNEQVGEWLVLDKMQGVAKVIGDFFSLKAGASTEGQ